MKPLLLFPLLLLPGLAAAAVQPGLDVRLTMAKDTFLTGEPLVFTLTVRNTTQKDVLIYHLERRIGAFEAIFEETATGRKRSLDLGTDQLMAMSARYTRIAPGQRVEAPFYLHAQPPFDTAGTYILRIKKTLLLATAPIPERDMKYLQQPVFDLDTRFTVAPPDTARMGGLVAGWGSEMLAGNTFSGDLLEGVNDERVISWYAALLRQPGRTDDKGQAIAALEKFTGSDAAFELLKNELAKPAALRDRVARAIANFTTKPAVPLLVALQNDPDPRVRFVVMHHLPELDLTAARTVADALRSDSSEWVRKLAVEYLEKVRQPALPCTEAGVHTWVELGADTLKPGAPMPAAFVLHNCTAREVYFDYNGDFDGWITKDFSFDESGPFEIELWSVTTGKKCPKRPGMPARGRLTGFAPVLPGNLYRIELPLHEWAVLDEPGAYRAVIARNVLLTRDRNWDRNSDPAHTQWFRATHEVFFVVSVGR